MLFLSKRFLCLATVVLASTGCRTRDNTAFLLESDDAFLDPEAQNMGVDLDQDAAELCAESGTVEDYQLRPVDGEASPTLAIKACVDQKFNLRSLDITLHQDDTTSTAKTDTIKVSIPTEYVVGIFESIDYEDSNGQRIQVQIDPETEYTIPGFPPLHFYTVSVNNGSPLLMYQANAEDFCPREWYAPDDAIRKFETANGNLVFETFACQSASVDGTVVDLPLWLAFETLPESLENDVRQSYRFLELRPHSSRRNFRHEVAIDELVSFVDEAADGGNVELYPSRIRNYRLESRADPCDLDNQDAELCLAEPSEMKWSYSLVRTCVNQAPSTQCDNGDMDSEYYCHAGEWRCRFQQISAASNKSFGKAQKGEICELGEEDIFLPHCAEGLECQQVDEEIARCF